MTRGPRPTTNRGRRAGGRELRAWASAAEFEAVTRAAEAAGVTREQFIREAALGSAGAVAAMAQELDALRALGASIHKAVASALEARAVEIDAKAEAASDAADKAGAAGDEEREDAESARWTAYRVAARIVRGQGAKGET